MEFALLQGLVILYESGAIQEGAIPRSSDDSL